MVATIACTDCGKLKTDYPSQLPKEPYRCRPCWNLRRRGMTWNIKKPHQSIKCERCHYVKHVTKSGLSKIASPYLCRRCSGARTYASVAVICKECGGVNFRKPHRATQWKGFCLKCKNKGARNSSWNGGKSARTCIICGQQRLCRNSYLAHRTRKDLCGKCFDKTKWKGENNPTYNGGTAWGSYAAGWSPELKDYIRTRDEFRYRLCEVHRSIVGLRRLDVHHIDYQKTNHDEFNLITLCRTCHAKTNFNREAWPPLLRPIIERIYAQLR